MKMVLWLIVSSLLLHALQALHTTESDNVRLVGGTRHCTGRLEMKHRREWRTVQPYSDWNQKSSSVVCRQLGCGSAVSTEWRDGSTDQPTWWIRSNCVGSESSVTMCVEMISSISSSSLELICSESGYVRLVGGTSHCTGKVEMKHHGGWRPVQPEIWNHQSSSVVCRQLGCGSAVSTKISEDSTSEDKWFINSNCVGSESSLRECGLMYVWYGFAHISLELICSESVRLVNGTSVCSGRVEVKSNQLWVSVCEGDFDQQDAEVVCRQLGCGAPSVLQGALYGEVKTPMWTKEFQCDGNESVLLDCRTSDSTRNTCKTVDLTCSEVLSDQCGQKAKPGVKTRCCGQEAYDADTQLCCGPHGSEVILTKASKDHECCGSNQYNPMGSCCCGSPLRTQPLCSSCCEEDKRQTLSGCCGGESYNSAHQMCCGSKIHSKTGPEPDGLNTKCCGQEAYDADTQLCCGPHGSEVILTKASKDHECCGSNQYNPMESCCCGSPLRTQPLSSSCCEQDKTQTLSG